MEQLAQLLQQVNDAASNLTGEILQAQGNLETLPDDQKQAKLAHLRAERVKVRAIIGKAVTALNKGIIGQLETIDKELTKCERIITE